MSETPDQPERREFLKKACSTVIGAAITAVPVAAGLAVYLDPLRRSSAGRNAIRVGRVKDFEPGVPKQVPIFSNRTDAWNRYPNSPIGAIFVEKISATQFRVFNASCPHAGCFVKPVEFGYFCPCHNSGFKSDGTVINPPAPRPLDTLKHTVKNGELFVDFVNFIAGKEEKKPST